MIIWYLIVIFIVLLSSCSKEKRLNYKETRQDLEMISAYKEAYKALNENDPYFAAKNF